MNTRYSQSVSQDALSDMGSVSIKPLWLYSIVKYKMLAAIAYYLPSL